MLVANRRAVTCVASGAVAYFDPVSHTYINEHGEYYLSGSTYANLFGYEFNAVAQAAKSAERYDVEPELFINYWLSKGEIASSFGTALHNALEHYGKYIHMPDIDGKPLGIHPTIEPIVLKFFEGREHEEAIYEAFVANELDLECGFIDRLVITGDKRCIIEDYKTNRDLNKKGKQLYLKEPADFLPNTPMGKYTLQLNFYQDQLEDAGWTVEGRRVHWWNGKTEEWETIEIGRVKRLEIPKLAPEFDVWVEN